MKLCRDPDGWWCKVLDWSLAVILVAVLMSAYWVFILMFFEMVNG